MKKLLPAFLTALLLSGAGLTASAQTSLTAAAYTPLLGDHFKIKMGNYIAPGNAGANQTWDFSALAVSSNEVNDFVSRSAAPYPASVPAANLVSKTSNNDYQYLEILPNGLRTHGAFSGSQNLFLTYTNPLDILFPMNYNVPYTDSYKATFTASGMNFVRSGTATFTYDGYGTVITPAGTFSNVIRLKLHDVIKDSTNLGGGFPYIINTVLETYDYILPGTRFPIARMVHATVGTNTQSRGMYLDVAALGKPEALAQEMAMNIFPNPATNNAETMLQYELKTAAEVNVTLVNMVGQEVLVLKNGKAFAGKQIQPIPVSKLPKGVYFVKLTTAGQVAMKRLIVQ